MSCAPIDAVASEAARKPLATTATVETTAAHPIHAVAYRHLGKVVDDTNSPVLADTSCGTLLSAVQMKNPVDPGSTGFSIVEAEVGIEPAYTDLQSAA